MVASTASRLSRDRHSNTALDARTTATFVAKVADDASAGTLAAVADPTTLGATCTVCATDQTVSLRQQSLRPRPSVKGKPVVGRTLRAAPGRVDPGTSLTYRWRVGGRVVAAGPIQATLTATALAETFGLALELGRTAGRWTARAV